MQPREVTSHFFIVPSANLQKGSSDYTLAAKLTKKQLIDRWKTAEGQDILHRWRANNFDRRTLDSLVGKFYDHTDIRGINLAQEDLSKADLSKVDLYGANLENTKLVEADLTESYLSEANIKGTCFDWARMRGVFLDNVDFDSKTSFIGVNLNEINFTLSALLQELATNQGRIVNLSKKRPILAAILRITCDYGRSFPRFFLTCFVVIFSFGLAYSFFPGSLAKTGSLGTSISFWDGSIPFLQKYSHTKLD